MQLLPLDSNQTSQQRGPEQQAAISLTFETSLEESAVSLSQSQATEPSNPEALGHLPQQPRKAWRIFASTFLTVFLAELGDKTQLTTLLMSAESQSPWIVFTGAALALILTSLLGVWLGQWLSRRIAPKVLETAAGISLLLIALWLIWDVVASQ